MTRRSYEFFSLWLPVVVPLLILGRHYYITPIVEGEFLAMMYGYIVPTSTAVALPYIVFAIAISGWAAARVEESVIWVSWCWPALFVPFCVLGTMMESLYMGRGFKPTESIDLAIASVVLGFVYVVFAKSVGALLRILRIIGD